MVRRNQSHHWPEKTIGVTGFCVIAPYESFAVTVARPIPGLWTRTGEEKKQLPRIPRMNTNKKVSIVICKQAVGNEMSICY